VTRTVNGTGQATYDTFEAGVAAPSKAKSWTRKTAGGVVAALALVAVLGASTVSRVSPMFDVVSAASGGIEFERTVAKLADGFNFMLSLEPGCTATDMYGCAAADLAWGDTMAVTADLSTPGTPLTATGAVIGWDLQVKAGIFPTNVQGECPVCGPKGTICEVIIPLVDNIEIPLSECPPPTEVETFKFATNLTLTKKAPNLGPIKKIKVVEDSKIYLKDAAGATIVELEVQLKVD